MSEITDDGDEEMQEGAQEAADGPTSEMPEDMEDAESEEASESWRPPSGANDSPRRRLQGLYPRNSTR